MKSTWPGFKPPKIVSKLVCDTDTTLIGGRRIGQRQYQKALRDHDPDYDSEYFCRLKSELEDCVFA
jgi:hypothetical protein